MDETKFNVIRNAKQGISNLNKAGVGLMTIQLATTVRNTTNGYMRNYMYALDNLGAGLIDYVGGNIKKISSLSDSALKQEAQKSVEYGKAQLRAGIDSLLLKDLIIGMIYGLFKALTNMAINLQKIIEIKDNIIQISLLKNLRN